MRLLRAARVVLLSGVSQLGFCGRQSLIMVVVMVVVLLLSLPVDVLLQG